jgi:hypothetical protein
VIHPSTKVLQNHTKGLKTATHQYWSRSFFRPILLVKICRFWHQKQDVKARNISIYKAMFFVAMGFCF